MKPPPRAYTADEVRQQFLEHLRWIVDHCNHTPIPTDIKAVIEARGESEAYYRSSLVVFSILVLIDGVSGSSSMPPFDLVTGDDETGKEERRAEGKNWYDDVTINGGCYLHDLWHATKK